MITDDLIARRPSGRAGLADWYDAVFEAQDAEGLTTAELATLLEVTATNLYYWKRRLRKRSTDERTADPKTTGAGLVEVRVAPPTSSSGGFRSPGALELRLAHGRSILVPSGFKPEDLRALVGVLEAC